MRLLLATFVLASGSVWAQAALPPLTTEGRLQWVATNTGGVRNLTGGVLVSAWGTRFNRPKEYGTHWEGFGKRYVIRLTGGATSDAMEASLGALWGEDPRYHPLGSGQNPGQRLKYAMKQAFLAHDRDGNSVPAYARYAAISGSNFLSNTWRADSEAHASDAVIRTGLGFAARITSNMVTEFWPDIIGRH